jgi:ribosomal protein L7/L12
MGTEARNLAEIGHRKYKFAVALTVDGEKNPMVVVVTARSMYEAIGKVVSDPFYKVDVSVVSGISAVPVDSTGFERLALEKLLEGKKIGAIIAVRNESGWNLKESKLYVENVQRDFGVTPGDMEQEKISNKFGS